MTRIRKQQEIANDFVLSVNVSNIFTRYSICSQKLKREHKPLISEGPLSDSSIQELI